MLLLQKYYGCMSVIAMLLKLVSYWASDRNCLCRSDRGQTRPNHASALEKACGYGPGEQGNLFYYKCWMKLKLCICFHFPVCIPCPQTLQSSNNAKSNDECWWTRDHGADSLSFSPEKFVFHSINVRMLGYLKNKEKKVE